MTSKEISSTPASMHEIAKVDSDFPGLTSKMVEPAGPWCKPKEC